MNCPNCNTTNPAHATKCECGYVFEDYEAEIATSAETDNSGLLLSINNTISSLQHWVFFEFLCTLGALFLLFDANISNGMQTVAGFMLLIRAVLLFKLFLYN